MDDLISRQVAIVEIEYELEMINSALDSTTLDFNARERLRQRRGEARELLNSIQQIPPAQPEIIRCKTCRYWEASSPCDVYPGLHRCIHWTRKTSAKEDDFCSYAERRKE